MEIGKSTPDSSGQTMRVLPVIDLKDGVVVHAIAGNRDHYQPIRSVLTDRSDPISVATAFRTSGFAEIYVADLGAIAGGSIDSTAVQQIGDSGLQIMLDAGVFGSARARELVTLSQQITQLAAFVVGLESLPDEVTLRASLEIFGTECCIFSLDLRRGEPITRCAAWQQTTALEVAEAAIDLGIRRILVLDLAHVGTGQGPAALDLCHQLHDRYPDVEIISGGGVRGTEDLKRLAAAGCSAALVASALHDGRLKPHGNRESPADTGLQQ